MQLVTENEDVFKYQMKCRGRVLLKGGLVYWPGLVFEAIFERSFGFPNLVFVTAFALNVNNVLRVAVNVVNETYVML